MSPMPPLPESVTDPLGDLTGYEAAYGDVPDEQEAAVEQAIGDASSLVRALAGITISQVTDDDVTLDGSGSRILLLPEWPVTDITDLTVVDEDDALVAPDDYEWSESLGIVYRRWGRVWPYRPQAVSLTYTHGWEVVPGDVARIVYSLAARMVASPDGRDVRSKTLGQASITYADIGTLGLTVMEEAVIARLRLR